MFNRAACLASESESAVTKTEWIYEERKTQEPLNMTWAGKQSEEPRSFQSPETYLLLTFPFIELRKISDQELIRFGKEVPRLAENPFQRQPEEVRKEWKRRKALVSTKRNSNSTNEGERELRTQPT